STTSAIYYNGIFDVPNPEDRLRINMTAQSSIVLARVEKALTLPSAALGARAGGDRYRVRVLEQGRVAERVVRIGLNNRVRAQVLEGLKEGEQVVTSEAGPAGATSAGNQRRGPPPF
ncbi:MAG TPA: efflux transporter periplasmic adaptor subunit, partial [Roseateles sp.]